MPVLGLNWRILGGADGAADAAGFVTSPLGIRDPGVERGAAPRILAFLSVSVLCLGAGGAAPGTIGWAGVCEGFELALGLPGRLLEACVSSAGGELVRRRLRLCPFSSVGSGLFWRTEGTALALLASGFG